ncbi:MAG TPA: hypothetical protein VFB45_21580 [Pseudolabrys sp.]|nr:hypothetical protein [Pseudolabrys sp.]
MVFYLVWSGGPDGTPDEKLLSVHLDRDDAETAVASHKASPDFRASQGEFTIEPFEWNARKLRGEIEALLRDQDPEQIAKHLELSIRADRVRTLDDFVGFLDRYWQALHRGTKELENPDTVQFLECMHAWLETTSKRPELVGHEMLHALPAWSTFARILLTASTYE